MDSSALDPWAIDAGWGEVVDGHRDKLEKILNALQAEVARIREDANLSVAGKAQRTASAASRTREAIDQVGIPQKLSHELAKVEALLPAMLTLPPDPADPSMANPLGPPAVRLRMVLDRLIALGDTGDLLRLRNTLMSAARAGDPWPIVASQNAPAFVLSVDPKVLEEAVEAYHEATNAEAVKVRVLLGRVRGRISTNLQLAHQQTGALAGPGVAGGVTVEPVAV